MSNEETKTPSKEELIAFLQEQIEVKKVQLELQELNTSWAMAKAEEVKALGFIAQMTTAPKSSNEAYEGGTPHKITQEDLELNPELSEQGFNVGDDVIIPNESTSKRSLKK